MARCENGDAEAVKLLRTIRFDPSDTFVFERAAEPGEWAVPGTFLFWDQDVAALQGKARSAFRSGLLGVASLGWSTLAVVTDASEAERELALGQLASQLHESLGAPDLASARTAAEQEIAFAASLCDHPAQTLIAVHRTWDGSDIREQFRTLRPRGDGIGRVRHDRVVAFVQEDESDPVTEEVDFAQLGKQALP
jgi:hypothetical protein